MTLLPQEVIRRKRDGAELGEAEIAFMVQGISDGSIGEGQVAAFAMAVFFRGMSMDERVALTRCMVDSGVTMNWSGADLPGPPLDKHSTGGVGDKVSLILGPLVAACGGVVPMISGRGLGHTGGTLDKFDSIPGYDTAPDNALFRRTVKEAGCAIIGQTADLAPADRRFYAIRDVTATVESIPLITASILSKKLAAGLSGLVMDIKVGSGAFAAEIAMARELAASIVAVANGAGLATTALITDMDQVLGRSVGNALEVAEAVAFLKGQGRDPRLLEVVLALAAEMLVLGKLVADIFEGRMRLQDALAGGRPVEVFSRMVAGLGGPADFVERMDDYLPRAPVVKPCLSDRPGVVAAMDARRVGVAVVALGGGRANADDAIDHSVGLSDVRFVGEAVGDGRPLAMVHASSGDAADKAVLELKQAIRVADEAPAAVPVVLERIAGP